MTEQTDAVLASLQLQAQGDQLHSAAKVLANALAGYYKALREEGMEPSDALNLTMDYQRLLFHTSRQPPPQPR
jgi:hypothetical protein